MKPLIFSRITITAILMLVEAGLQAFLKGGDAWQIIQAVLAVAMIVFRQLTTTRTYLFKAPAVVSLGTPIDVDVMSDTNPGIIIPKR